MKTNVGTVDFRGFVPPQCNAAQSHEKLRVLSKAREDRERAREQDQFILDEAVRERLIAMTEPHSKFRANRV